MNQPVAMGLRAYRALASAFPQEFQNIYGPDLERTAEDSITAIWREHGLLGLVRLLLDLAIRIPLEHLAELSHDIRYGFRMLCSSPGFTAVAVISLTLGIAVATAAFGKLNGTVFRSVPGVANAADLVAVQSPVSYPNYLDFQTHRDLFGSTLAFVAPVPFGVLVDGHNERVFGHLVTPDYFSTLGVKAAKGRLWEDRPGDAAPAMVISDRFWKTRLGADPGIIGRSLRVNGKAVTIAAVAPESFLGASPMVFPADLWLPVTTGEEVAPELAHHALDQRNLSIFHMVARLKPGVTDVRAEAELDGAARQIEQAYADPNRDRKGAWVVMLPGGKMLPVRKQDLPMLTLFPMLLVALILLIACSNVANMMLARAAHRRKEIAVRLSLGASRVRLIKQLLTESMMISVASGALGLLLGFWILRLQTTINLPLEIPVNFDLSVDWRVLSFTLALTIVTGIAFGLVPALQATSTDLTPALKEGGGMQLRGYRRFSLRNLLVLSQVAGSLMLLLLTGFMVTGFQKTTAIEVGFEPHNLSLISLDPVRDGYPPDKVPDLFQKLIDRVKLMPSVTSATLTDTIPMALSSNAFVNFSTVENGKREVYSAHKAVVGAGYFETVGIPLLQGRNFRRDDLADDATAVVVSEQFQRELLGGRSPLGQRIEVDNDSAQSIRGLEYLGTLDHRQGGRRVYDIVGVAKDVKVAFEMGELRPTIYFPLHYSDYALPATQGVTLMVRTLPGVDAVLDIRRELSLIDSNLAPFNARRMTDQIDDLLFLIRIALWVYGGIGLFGLILASVGLGGVTAYSVAQRRREIGIRMALGATRNNVLALVMREGAILVAIGSVIGLAGAWGGARLLSTMIAVIASATDASISDPFLLVGAPSLLAGLAMIACYVPARRSMAIDPAVALRQD